VVARLVVFLQNVGRIPWESFGSLTYCLQEEGFAHSRLPVAEAVDRSLLLVVEGFDGRTVPRILDGEEDLGRQLEEADIPDHSEEELDSFLKSKYLKESRLTTRINYRRLE